MSRTRVALACLAVVLLASLAWGVWAWSSARHEVGWWVSSGSGGPSASGSENVTLNASLGQTAIGPSSSTQYDLGAGYWYGIQGEEGEEGEQIYLPILLRNY